ncbi:MAG TPA: hypothetical protein VFL64_00735 [Rhizobacter sp.]|nr:hypothetical protein [Rhizobacter sp.]
MPLRLTPAFAVLLLAACGGGGGGDAPSTGPSAADREAAARATALGNPACVTAQPFYWTVGDTSGPLAGGSVGANAPGAGTNMAIASASKWLYASHVAELRQGQLSADDVKALNFTSGYTGFDSCLQDQTVAECQSYQGALIRNGDYVPAHDGRFYYSGGHMQRHATLASVGLGPDANAALAQHVAAGLGGVMTLTYTQPQLAGGAATNATEYGRFLRRVLAGEMRISSLLGTNKVCTNPSTCATAVATPIPLQESWHYAVGHWVEDDPVVGDGAFSSPGAFGFYPWIDANRRYWGVLARYSTTGTGNADPAQRPYVQSVACGRQIRAAWLSATPRTTP